MERRSQGTFWTGILMGGLGMLAFSGTLPATRVAAPVFGATLITSARIEVAALLGAGTLLILGRGQLSLPDRRHWSGLVCMGLGLAVAYPFLVAVALQQVPSAHGAVVVGVAPAATALAACVRLGERPPRRFWIACAAGVGTIIVFAVRQGGGHISLADGWLLLAVASVGVAYVEGGRISKELGSTPTLCWAMIIMAPLATPLLAWSVIEYDWTGPSPGSAWAGLAYACLVSMFLGSIAWYRGLAQGGVARIGQLNLIQPLVALLWSALLLGEEVTAFSIGCACIIFAAMMICVRCRIEAAAKPGNPLGRT